MTTPLAIHCVGLTKTYPTRPPVEAVRGIDLSVMRGECFGVLGPNGAGKTTTIEILEGLLEPTSGDVEVLGMRWESQADQLRQRIGISLQETKLSDKLTVSETLTLFRSFYRQAISTDEAMGRVGLREKASAWVKNLSGGQRQRLALATALVGEPDLLFLDEPTTGLDPQSRRQLWDVLEQFRREGRTVLLTTHYMEEAERLCDRVAVVDQGKVIALGTPRELIARWAGANVVEFTVVENTGKPAAPTMTTDCQSLPEVTSVHVDNGCIRLATGKPHVVIPQLLQLLQQRSLPLAHLSTRQGSLEDVFLNLTGRHLDDQDQSA